MNVVVYLYEVSKYYGWVLLLTLRTCMYNFLIERISDWVVAIPWNSSWTLTGCFYSARVRAEHWFPCCQLAGISGMHLNIQKHMQDMIHVIKQQISIKNTNLHQNKREKSCILTYVYKHLVISRIVSLNSCNCNFF